MSTSVPKDGTGWVLNLDDPEKRMIVMVEGSLYDEEVDDWEVVFTYLPDRAGSLFMERTPFRMHTRRFWEEASPIGDAINNMSEMRSPTQPEN